MSAPVTERRLKWWGWGYEDQQPDRAGLEEIAKSVHERLGFELDQIEEPVPLEAVELPEPRLKAPKELGEMFSAERYDRVSHALGKASRDVLRGMRGQFEHPPDLVAYPESPEDVDAVLNFCADQGAAAIPFSPWRSRRGSTTRPPSMKRSRSTRGRLPPDFGPPPAPRADFSSTLISPSDSGAPSCPE